jgi:hypothetical protein
MAPHKPGAKYGTTESTESAPRASPSSLETKPGSIMVPSSGAARLVENDGSPPVTRHAWCFSLSIAG